MQNAQVLTPSSVLWSVAENLDRSDRGLLKEIAAGDRHAMRLIFARHKTKVYRFVARIIGDESKAEDVVSEVFFEVWRQASRFEGRSEVATWIFAIARHKAISIKNEHKHEVLEDGVAESIIDGADDPHILLEKKDSGKLLRQCLQKLSPMHREIIDLVYYHQMSIAEAAKIVGVPCDTVKTRMFNARKKMALDQRLRDSS